MARRRSGNNTGSVPSWVQALGGSLFNVMRQNVSEVVDTKTPRKLLDQLGQWIGHLSQNAAIEWVPSVLRNEQCYFCSDIAMSRCCVCNLPCCLGHAHVSFRAELVCDGCLGKLLGDGPIEKAPKTPETEAFEYFNLLPSATFEEVNAVYKARAKEHHPDKGGSPQEMAKAGQHLLVLKRYFDKQAAA